MRSIICSILFGIFIVNHVSSQSRNSNPLNSFLNDIVHTQINNSLDYTLPIFVVTPGFFIIGNLELPNDRIYFTDKEELDTPKKKAEEIIVGEIMKYVRFNPISFALADSMLLIKAYDENKQLLRIGYQVDSEVKSIKMVLPNEKFLKEIRYQDDKVLSTVTEKSDNVYSCNFEYFGDTMVVSTRYDSKSEKYTVRSEKFKQGRIVEEIRFKKSRNSKKRKCKERKYYTYHSDGRLNSIVTKNRRGHERGATHYSYENDELKEVRNLGKHGGNVEIYYYTPEKVLKKKEVILPNEIVESKLEMNYEFNQSEKLEHLLVRDDLLKVDFIYELSYNTENKLIEVNSYKKFRETKREEILGRYTFTYYQNGMIETIRQIDKKGKIIKEIKYEVEYLN